MRRVMTNKLGFIEIVLLLAFVLTGSVLQGAPSAVVADGPWMPPSPWDNVQLADGPWMPPSPWDNVQLADGPWMPPSPWDNVQLADGPWMPPSPWDNSVVV